MTKMNIPFSPPDIEKEEINLVIDTLKSGWITTGPKTKLFEKELSEYIGTNKTVCLNSATAAMETTLRVLGIGPGDEVITSAYTYTASASIIEHVGAKIVLVDTQKDSFEMDYQQVADAITENTKLIIPVDIAGKLCDYETLYNVLEMKKDSYTPNNEIQEQFDRIIVMADAAHSFGAEKNGIQAGLHADFTCFSFHAVKNLTTGEGGAVTWKPSSKLDDEYLYKEYQLYSLHGQSKDALAKAQKGSWEYDIIYTGYKCNMTDVQAAIGLAQLKRYPELLERRKNIVQMYNDGFKKINIQLVDHYNKESSSSGHLYLTRIEGINETQRNKIIIEMANAGISTNVHYKPLPMLTAYKNLGFDITDYHNAFDYYRNEITLPLHTGLSDEEVHYIIDTYSNILKKYQ